MTVQVATGHFRRAWIHGRGLVCGQPPTTAVTWMCTGTLPTHMYTPIEPACLHPHPPLPPSHRKLPGAGSVSDHMLTSYQRAMMAVLAVQFSSKMVDGGKEGALALAQVRWVGGLEAHTRPGAGRGM